MNGMDAYPADGSWARGYVALEAVGAAEMSFATLSCLGYVIREIPDLAASAAQRAAHLGRMGLDKAGARQAVMA